MKTKAAVATAARKPLEIMTVDLDGPKAGEVLVEIKASGVCHTDEFTRSGADPEGLFPAILGHEGAGIVVDVGPGVTSVRKGDHVIPLYTPECRQCKSCTSRKTNLCTAIRATQGKGLMPDGTSRFSIGKDMVHHYMGCSTFSNFTVLPEIAVAKIREDAPFDKVCYIGCGVTTGIGAVINTAKVEAGANVVVFGLGGIGLNVVQGARLVGANKIIGVDLNPARKALAEKFGLTHFVNPKEVGGDLVAHLVALTDGGADYSFECVGNVDLMRQALECCHRGWGVSVIIGVAGAGKEISTRPFQLVTGRVWKGTAFGGARGRTDVPKIVDWYMDGKINIDDLITHKMPLAKINTRVRFDALRRIDPQRGGLLVTTLNCISEHACYGGEQRFYRHDSRETRGPMKFSVYLPPQANAVKVPVLYFLSGLTCTEETFCIKSHAQKCAAELGLMLISPGHQPARAAHSRRRRSLGLRLFRRLLCGCHAGTLGAKLSDVQLCRARAAADCGRAFSRNPRRDRNIRPFHGRPRRAHLGVAQPGTVQVGFGICADCGALAMSLGPARHSAIILAPRLEIWSEHDATELVARRAYPGPILIDQGTADQYLAEQLLPEKFAAAAAKSGQRLSLRMQPGYDHGYYFIQTFMADHLRHHAQQLGSPQLTAAH